MLSEEPEEGIKMPEENQILYIVIGNDIYIKETEKESE